MKIDKSKKSYKSSIIRLLFAVLGFSLCVIILVDVINFFVLFSESKDVVDVVSSNGIFNFDSSSDFKYDFLIILNLLANLASFVCKICGTILSFKYAVK